MIGKATDRRWIAGALVVYVSCVGLLYGFVVRPMMVKVDRAEKGKQLLADYGVLQNAREVLQEFEESVVGDLESEFGDVAYRWGVLLDEAVLDTVWRWDGVLDRTRYRLRFRGGYHQIGGFVGELEGSAYFVEVGELSITVASEGDEGHFCECVVSSFRQKQKKKKAKA